MRSREANWKDRRNNYIAKRAKRARPVSDTTEAVVEGV